MSRKAILEGGKRDEIIYAAMQLFFENGYEATSVRMILDRVGGEIGMFYHYFKSKDELFQIVVERFFLDYKSNFAKMAQTCDSTSKFVEYFLEFYDAAMQKFHSLSPNMHWSILYAMAAKTIEELMPVFVSLLNQWGYHDNDPIDIVASQLLYSISGTIHSSSFTSLAKEEKKLILESLISRLL